MKQIRLIAAMPDQTYLKLLNGYLRTSDLSNQWSLECFSAMEHLQQRLGTGDADAVIIHPQWLEEVRASSIPLNARLLCAWSDSPSVEHINGYPAIFKYQSVILIFHHIKSLLREQMRIAGNGDADARIGQNVRTIAIYSAAGGAGKTTLAVHLLEMLARRLQPVLYIGLELTSSLEAFVQEDGGMDFSRLLYEMEHGGESFEDKLRQAIRRDSLRGFYYLPPFLLAEDAAVMTSEQTRHLLAQVRSLGMFEAIVLDLESSLHDRIRGAFEAADEIWWLSADESVCLMKTAKRMEEWSRALGEQWQSVSQRIRHIVNRSVDRNMSSECRRIVPSPAGILPDVPEWRRGSHVPPLAAGNAYIDGLRQLYVVSEREGGIRDG